ncbi:MAG: hypothetical protein DRP87_18855 [Spirochaetes bacterium]|nr:MAG: hypothetical protein DRP87_18855 [Spirochaetota bacterium]
MALITVKFLGIMRDAAGRDALTVSPASAGEALKRFTEALPGVKGMISTANGSKLNGDIRIFVNGGEISFLKGLETPLGSKDRLAVLQHGARGYPGG